MLKFKRKFRRQRVKQARNFHVLAACNATIKLYSRSVGLCDRIKKEKKFAAQVVKHMTYNREVNSPTIDKDNLHQTAQPNIPINSDLHK